MGFLCDHMGGGKTMRGLSGEQLKWTGGVVKILVTRLDTAPGRSQSLVGIGVEPPKMEAQDQNLYTVNSLNIKD